MNYFQLSIFAIDLFYSLLQNVNGISLEIIPYCLLIFDNTTTNFYTDLAAQKEYKKHG